MDVPVAIATPVTEDNALDLIMEVFTDQVINALGQRARNNYLDRVRAIEGMTALIIEAAGSLTPDAVRILERSLIKLSHELLESFWGEYIGELPESFAQVEAMIEGWEAST
jgi:hypothetical protein